MAHSSHTYGSTDQRSDLPDVGFSPTELYSLSENITANIYTINSSYKTLSRSFKLIGTNKDNQAVRDRVTLEFDHGLILEQEERIKQIEGDILDVNQVMRELGALVHQQADSINSIENNIENAHGHVELGAQELIKASNYQNKFRRKICILLVVAITFVIILILVIVLSKKSS
ncbi:unnamed protein product [Trichogramma brassicae]|uniref:t-SNARE coiled-coil homology domain-containing protein n=1 Tax=Trichogramma brassicae TaxID=86971 RepID=A0A6H5IN03_9HYME|nr:unnamed protein product [Trichogramma brassicae]